MRFRMIYLTAAAPNRPHSLPLIAPNAHDATRLAETLCALPGWVLLTVKHEAPHVDRSPLARTLQAQ